MECTARLTLLNKCKKFSDKEYIQILKKTIEELKEKLKEKEDFIDNLNLSD